MPAALGMMLLKPRQDEPIKQQHQQQQHQQQQQQQQQSQDEETSPTPPPRQQLALSMASPSTATTTLSAPSSDEEISPPPPPRRTLRRQASPLPTHLQPPKPNYRPSQESSHHHRSIDALVDGPVMPLLRRVSNFTVGSHSMCSISDHSRTHNNNQDSTQNGNNQDSNAMPSLAQQPQAAEDQEGNVVVVANDGHEHEHEQDNPDGIDHIDEDTEREEFANEFVSADAILPDLVLDVGADLDMDADRDDDSESDISVELNDTSSPMPGQHEHNDDDNDHSNRNRNDPNRYSTITTQSADTVRQASLSSSQRETPAPPNPLFHMSLDGFNLTAGEIRDEPTPSVQASMNTVAAIKARKRNSKPWLDDMENSDLPQLKELKPLHQMQPQSQSAVVANPATPTTDADAKADATADATADISAPSPTPTPATAIVPIDPRKITDAGDEQLHLSSNDMDNNSFAPSQIYPPDSTGSVKGFVDDLISTCPSAAPSHPQSIATELSGQSLNVHIEQVYDKAIYDPVLNINGIYSGEWDVMSKMPHGMGILVYDNKRVFQGKLLFGHLVQGSMKYEDGKSQYTGQWYNQVPDGAGTMYYGSTGQTFYGTFTNGQTDQGIVLEPDEKEKVENKDDENEEEDKDKPKEKPKTKTKGSKKRKDKKLTGASAHTNDGSAIPKGSLGDGSIDTMTSSKKKRTKKKKKPTKKKAEAGSDSSNHENHSNDSGSQIPAASMSSTSKRTKKTKPRSSDDKKKTRKKQVSPMGDARPAAGSRDRTIPQQRRRRPRSTSRVRRKGESQQRPHKPSAANRHVQHHDERRNQRPREKVKRRTKSSSPSASLRHRSGEAGHRTHHPDRPGRSHRHRPEHRQRPPSSNSRSVSRSRHKTSKRSEGGRSKSVTRDGHASPSTTASRTRRGRRSASPGRAIRHHVSDESTQTTSSSTHASGLPRLKKRRSESVPRKFYNIATNPFSMKTSNHSKTSNAGSGTNSSASTKPAGNTTASKNRTRNAVTAVANRAREVLLGASLKHTPSSKAGKSDMATRARGAQSKSPKLLTSKHDGSMQKKKYGPATKPNSARSRSTERESKTPRKTDHNSNNNNNNNNNSSSTSKDLAVSPYNHSSKHYDDIVLTNSFQTEESMHNSGNLSLQRHQSNLTEQEEPRVLPRNAGSVFQRTTAAPPPPPAVVASSKPQSPSPVDTKVFKSGQGSTTLFQLSDHHPRTAAGAPQPESPHTSNGDDTTINRQYKRLQRERAAIEAELNKSPQHIRVVSNQDLEDPDDKDNAMNYMAGINMNNRQSWIGLELECSADFAQDDEFSMLEDVFEP